MDDNEKEEIAESETAFDDDSSMSPEHIESSENGGQSEEQEQSDEGTETEENQDDGSEKSETGEEETSEEDTSKEEGSETTDKGKNGEEERTSKGTKKDPNPINALNQELANAKRFNTDMIRLLEDPEALTEYLNNLKKEKVSAGAVDDKGEADFNIDEEVKNLKTVEDLQNFAKKFVGKVNKDLDSHKTRIEKGEQRQRFIENVEKIGGQIKSDVQAVRQARPELIEFNADGSKNPKFNPVLDKLIGETFEALEFDKKTGLFRGQVPFSFVAKTILAAWDQGGNLGSKRAQTIVFDKRRGRVVSGTGKRGGVVNESGMSAEQILANRMKNAFSKARGNRR